MEKILRAAVERGASDLHIKAGDVFRARIDGRLVALTKQALQQALTGTLDEALDREAELQQLAGDHWEHLEGVTAFKEKRAAEFVRGE